LKTQAGTIEKSVLEINWLVVKFQICRESWVGFQMVQNIIYILRCNYGTIIFEQSKDIPPLQNCFIFLHIANDNCIPLILLQEGDSSHLLHFRIITKKNVTSTIHWFFAAIPYCTKKTK
jgi:hypothetical protein